MYKKRLQQNLTEKRSRCNTALAVILYSLYTQLKSQASRMKRARQNILYGQKKKIEAKIAKAENGGCGRNKTYQIGCRKNKRFYRKEEQKIRERERKPIKFEEHECRYIIHDRLLFNLFAIAIELPF